MVLDLNRYQPPGVYMGEESSPSAVPVTLLPSVVALVGPGIGYRTATEAVTLTGTTGVELARKGVRPLSVVVKSAGGTVYARGTATETTDNPAGSADYDLTVTIPAGGVLESTVVVNRTPGSTIANPETVYVTYQFTDAEYYQPLRFSDYDSLKATYGEPLDLVTGAVTSPMSLAAKVAFDNDASEIIAVATEGVATAVTRTQLAAGLAKTAALADIGLVVPLTPGIANGDVQGVAEDLRTHLNTTALDGYRRVGLLSFDTGVTTAPDVSVDTIRDRRLVLAWPYSYSFYIGTLGRNVNVGGFYEAAGLAAILGVNEVQEPLTRKQVRGFSGVSTSVFTTMTPSLKNQYSADGVTVTELDRSGRMVVRHGLTTDRTSTHNSEISLVRSRDALIQLVEDATVNSDLIGSAVTDNTLLIAKSVVQGALERAVAEGVIVSYTGLVARIATTDPTVIEIRFQYKPSYPLNYITITYSVNLVTGEFDSQELLAA